MNKLERKKLASQTHALLMTGIIKNSQEHILAAYKGLGDLLAGDGIYVLNDAPKFPESENKAETKPELEVKNLVRLIVTAYGKQNSEFLTLIGKYAGTVYENDPAIVKLKSWVKDADLAISAFNESNAESRLDL
jgi:hypothetical protein